MGNSTDPNIQQPKKENELSTIELSTPWGGCQGVKGSNIVLGTNYSLIASEGAEEFIRQRSLVHLQYIIEENKTKRLALLASVALVIAGGLILVYAPPANRVLADLVGISLIVAAGGAAGFKRLWFRSSNRSFAADTGDTQLPSGSFRSKRRKQ